MKPDLVILAAGGTGRELAELTADRFNVLGFLDDVKTGPRVLGTMADLHRFLPGAKICSGLGSYRSMTRRRQILQGMPIEAFVTYVAADARVYSSATIGKAVTVFPGSIVTSDARLGDHSYVYHNCVVAHDANLGDYTILSNSVTVSGNVTIGKNCYIGAGSTILEGVTIGDDCVIAAGATVISDVEPGKIYIAPNKLKDNSYR